MRPQNLIKCLSCLLFFKYLLAVCNNWWQMELVNMGKNLNLKKRKKNCRELSSIILKAMPQNTRTCFFPFLIPKYLCLCMVKFVTSRATQKLYTELSMLQIDRLMTAAHLTLLIIPNRLHHELRWTIFYVFSSNTVADGCFFNNCPYFSPFSRVFVILHMQLCFQVCLQAHYVWERERKIKKSQI